MQQGGTRLTQLAGPHYAKLAGQGPVAVRRSQAAGNGLGRVSAGNGFGRGSGSWGGGGCGSRAFGLKECVRMHVADNLTCHVNDGNGSSCHPVTLSVYRKCSNQQVSWWPWWCGGAH